MRRILQVIEIEINTKGSNPGLKIYKKTFNHYGLHLPFPPENENKWVLSKSAALQLGMFLIRAVDEFYCAHEPGANSCQDLACECPKTCKKCGEFYK
jgi:hypothetical protein